MPSEVGSAPTICDPPHFVLPRGAGASTLPQPVPLFNGYGLVIDFDHGVNPCIAKTNPVAVVLLYLSGTHMN